MALLGLLLAHGIETAPIEPYAKMKAEPVFDIESASDAQVTGQAVPADDLAAAANFFHQLHQHRYRNRGFRYGGYNGGYGYPGYGYGNGYP